MGIFYELQSSVWSRHFRTTHMLPLRLIFPRRFGQSSCKRLLHARSAKIMEASSSQTTPHTKSKTPTKESKKDNSPPTSPRPQTPKAYIPPHLRKTAPAPDATSEIHDLSQSINRVSLNDSQSSNKPKSPSANSKPRARHLETRGGGRAAQRVYGDFSNTDMAERDARVQPSKASGGVPNPTPAYLTITTQPYQVLNSPQNLLVVIDLNGTLLYRPNRKNPTKFVARPHAVRFLRYCIDTFTVVIWSSARPENVRNMCDAILTPEMRGKIAAIWARDKFNFTPQDYNLRVQCYKRLTTLWNDEAIQKAHAQYETGGRWDQTNTVLVDDSINKGRSEPFNLIEIPEFFGNGKETGDILPQVHDYLNRLAMHSNVSSYMRSCPFSTAQQALAQQIPLQHNQAQQRQTQQPKSGPINPDVIEID